MSNTNDRELLELAAKAAGHEVARWTDDGTALLLVGIQAPWNSLHENPHSDCMGDALRLAVRLNMELCRSKLNEPRPWVSAVIRNTMFHGAEDIGADPDAATRRAITRAAAATIGRTAPAGG